MRATKAIIHLNNLEHNILELRKNIKKDTKICVAVKADSYGHGAVECSKRLEKIGVDFLAVAAVEEGIELRENNITLPILMLSLCTPEEISLAVKYKITPFVFDKEYIQLFANEVKKQNIKNYPVHLAVDSGMGRIGCYKEEAGELAKYILSTEVLVLEGICTHFAVSDCCDCESDKFSKKQLDYFLEAVENVKKEGINPGILHASSSAAFINVKGSELNMIRPGIVAYGYYAGDVNKKFLEKNNIKLDLKPVMTFETKVSIIRDFEKDQSVGYGRTWKAKEKTKIAVLTAGYADGLLRKFAPFLEVAINGKNYPVRGRICMDQCMVEIGTDSDVKRWDRAVIFGLKEDGALQTAQDIADKAGTISYEVTSLITKRVEREYVD